MKPGIFSTVAFSLSILSGSALAGFQWVAPDVNTTPPIMEDPVIIHDFSHVAPPAEDLPMSMPSAPEMIEAINEKPQRSDEVVDSGAPKMILPDNAPESAKAYADKMNQETKAPADSMTMMPGYPPASAPVFVPNQPIVTAAPETMLPPTTAGVPVTNAVAVPPPAPVGNKDPITSFGQNIPLAIALQDIIPSSYSYAFQPGVNVGAIVSWNANNQPWDAVLVDMLAEKNMGFVITGNKVTIQNGMPAPAFVPVTSSAMPPVMPMEQQPVEMSSNGKKVISVATKHPASIAAMPRADLSWQEELIIVPSQRNYVAAQPVVSAPPTIPAEATNVVIGTPPPPIGVAPAQPNVAASPYYGGPVTITKPLTPAPF